jgi:hypothetical protein
MNPCFRGATFIGLANNKLWGEAGSTRRFTSRDFRYNYFYNCSFSCQSSEADNILCPVGSQIPRKNEVAEVKENGMKSEWVENRVAFLGSQMTIIQVEMTFETDLYGVDSIVCPYYGCEPEKEKVLTLFNCSELTLTQLQLNQSAEFTANNGDVMETFYLQVENWCETISVCFLAIFFPLHNFIQLKSF